MVNTTTYHLTSGRRIAIATPLAPVGTVLAIAAGHGLGRGVLTVVAVYLLALAGWVAMASEGREPWKVFALFVFTLVAGGAAILLVGIGVLWVACHNGGCGD